MEIFEVLEICDKYHIFFKVTNRYSDDVDIANYVGLSCYQYRKLMIDNFNTKLHGLKDEARINYIYFNQKWRADKAKEYLESLYIANKLRGVVE